MARKIGYRLGVISDLSDIGNIYRDKGKLDKALTYGNAALELARATGYRVGVATDLGNIGLILKDKREYEQAVPKLVQALTMLLASGISDGPRQVLSGLVKCENKLGRKRLEELFKEAGLDDQAAADLLDRLDQMHLKRPGPSRTRPTRSPKTDR
jgi:tetratricopeptide (TPR) repeat protein